MPSKPCIALLFDGLSLPAKDGVTYYFQHLARHLSQRDDIELRILLSDRQWTAEEAIRDEGWSFDLLPVETLYREPDNVAALLREYRVSAMHVCNSHSLVPFLGLRIAQAAGVKLVTTMHDLDHEVYATLGKDRDTIDEARRLQQTVGQLSDHVFVVSRGDVAAVRTLVPHDRISVAPHGIEPVVGGRCKPHGRTIVFLGNMDYEPNREAARFVCEEVAPCVRSVFEDAAFTFIGRIPAHFRNVQTAGCTFLGPVDNITPYLQASRLAVAPLWSGSGMKVKMLTYAAHGVPVLGTPIAAQGYKATAFFIEDRPEAFAGRIIELLSDHAQHALDSRSFAARAYVQEEFSWDRTASHVAQVYRDLASNPAEAVISGSCPRIEAQGSSILVNGRPFSLPLFMTEERFAAAGVAPS